MLNVEGGKNFKGPALQTPLGVSESIAGDPAKVLKLCTDFSSSVLESVMLILFDETAFEDIKFIENFRGLIQVDTDRRFLNGSGI
jgi:hypothetical protein